MAFSPSRIDAITLFVDDLPAAKEFYARAFALPVHFFSFVLVNFSYFYFFF